MKKSKLSLIGAKIWQVSQPLRVGLTFQSIAAKLNAITLVAIIGMLVLGSLSLFTLASLEAAFAQVRVLYVQGERVDTLLNLILKTSDGLNEVIREP